MIVKWKCGPPENLVSAPPLQGFVNKNIKKFMPMPISGDKGQANNIIRNTCKEETEEKY